MAHKLGTILLVKGVGFQHFKFNLGEGELKGNDFLLALYTIDHHTPNRTKKGEGPKSFED